MRVISAVVVGSIAAACGGLTAPIRLPEQPPTRSQLAELWIDPGADPRDLFYGVGGERHAPSRDAQYTFKAKDTTGFSASYDLVDPDGTEWSAKIGPEAQTEVLMSRLLWGLGFHQPPVYYLPSWNLLGEKGEAKKESEARFRPKLSQLTRLEEYWRWQENPFGGTRQLNGLLVVLLMCNSTDLKNDNNAIYQVTKPWPLPGAGEASPARWFVVRDLGAAFGETGILFPRRNWLEGFEEEGFIKKVEHGRIEFAYSGRHKELLGMIRPDDLEWGARLLERLTEAQWRDAFRAANYNDNQRERYLRKIRQKMDEALKAAAAARATD